MHNGIASSANSALLDFAKGIPRSRLAPVLKRLPLRTFIYNDVILRALSYLPMKRLIGKIRAQGRIEDIGRLIEFCFASEGGLIAPLQLREEIEPLLLLLRKSQVKTFLEIGTASGGTLFLFSSVAEKDAVEISIDLPPGMLGGGYPMHRKELYHSFAIPPQKLTLLKEDSHSQQTVEKARGILGGMELDFLFIDGDHSYGGVRKDFELYSALVKKGGIIAFHDIAAHPKESGCEVDRFWNEIKNKYRWQEFIKDRNQGAYGIGVLYK